MKKINRFLAIFVLVASFAMVVSCRDDDKDPFSNDITDGALIQFAAGDQPNFNFELLDGNNASGNNFVADLVDSNNNVSSYKLDLTATIGGMKKGPINIVEITSFPHRLEITPEQMATALGVTVDDIAGRMEFSATITTNKGVVYTAEAPSLDTETLEVGDGATEPTILTSTGYRHAFNFDVLYLCILDTPPTGDWIITLKDSFGDGWDGAKLTVSIDGTETDYTFTDGSEFGANFTVPDGTINLDITYEPGSFEVEHSYVITGPKGSVVVSEGPSPTSGLVTQILCAEQ